MLNVIERHEIEETVHADTPQEILRSCINCGCCNEICPTFNILNNENDGPRGRINLMRKLIEDNEAPDSHMVKHLDQCLSCTACQTVCPVDVDYRHLIDAVRCRIEERYQRPMVDRKVRNMLIETLPDPEKFRSRMKLAARYKGFSGLVSAVPGLKPLGALLDSVPGTIPDESEEVSSGRYAAKTTQARGKVMIPSGCVQKVLDPEINRAAIDLLTAAGIDVTLPDNDNCCGALVLHLGGEERALQQVRGNIDAWYPLVLEGLDAIVITTSGCGTTIKDYGNLMKDDPEYAQKAAEISALAMDVTEYLAKIKLPQPIAEPGLTVAYHAACSMQHTQHISLEPRKLLIDAGCKLTRPSDEHTCCGSAGTYSLLHSEIANNLGEKKAANLTEAEPDVIVGGNLGCLQHIGKSTDVPIIHTVQLLSWIYTGNKPKAFHKP